MSKTQKAVWWLVSAVAFGLAVAFAEHWWREAKRVKMRVTGTQSESGRWVFAAFELKGTNRTEHFIYSPVSPTLVWPGHTAVVEQAQVLLDGAAFTAVPAAATNIFLAVTSGVFAVRADGIELKAVPMAK